MARKPQPRKHPGRAPFPLRRPSSMRAFRTSQPFGAFGAFGAFPRGFPAFPGAFGFPGPFVRFSSFPFLLSPASSVSSTSRVLPGLVYAFPSSTPFLARLLGFLGFPGSSGPFVGFFFFSGFPGLPPYSSLCLLFRFFLFFSFGCGACRPPALSCTAHLFARGPRDFPPFRPAQGAVERIIVSVQEKKGSYASCRLDVGPAEALRGRVFPLLHQRKR